MLKVKWLPFYDFAKLVQKSVYKIKSDVILAFCQTTVGVSNLFHYKSRAKFFQEKVTVSIGLFRCSNTTHSEMW